MSEEMNDLCHKLLKEWCPKGLKIVKRDEDYPDALTLHWRYNPPSPDNWVLALTGYKYEYEENLPLPDGHIRVSFGGTPAISKVGPLSFEGDGLDVTLDLSDPRSTEFLKELITNLRRVK